MKKKPDLLHLRVLLLVNVSIRIIHSTVADVFVLARKAICHVYLPPTSKFDKRGEMSARIARTAT